MKEPDEIWEEILKIYREYEERKKEKKLTICELLKLLK
jgi:hypothetical protein